MSEESGWMDQPQAVAPLPQAAPAGVDRMRQIADISRRFVGGLGGLGRTQAPQAAAPTPQWSPASYAPSQMLNRPVPQSTWGGGRQMPQQPGNVPGQMPQQSNPMVRALRGG